jgi:hypothetical protein
MDMPLLCYNPSCGTSFANDNLRSCHCGQLPACQKAQFKYFSMAGPPPIKRWRTRIEEVEDKEMQLQAPTPESINHLDVDMEDCMHPSTHPTPGSHPST